MALEHFPFNYYQNLTERAGGREGWSGNSVGGGSTVGVSSTSKNHPSHDKYKSLKQFELKRNWKALEALDARWPLPVYPVFKDKKSKASDEKSVKRKIA